MDGHGYYRIYNMLSEGASVESLDPARKVEIPPKMVAAMHDVSGGIGAWLELRKLLAGTTTPVAIDGVVAAHSFAAREEAARKIIHNHVALLRDGTTTDGRTKMICRCFWCLPPLR